MTLENDNEIITVSRINWFLIDKNPIYEMSEDTKMLVARYRVDHFTGKVSVCVEETYLGNIIKSVDNNGNAIVDDDIYAWSLDYIQAPANDEIEDLLLRKARNEENRNN